MNSENKILEDLLNDLYDNRISLNLKMPFIEHINLCLRYAKKIKGMMSKNDFVSLVGMVLFHDTIMVYPNMDLAEELYTRLKHFHISKEDVIASSFKNTRDKFGGNDWSKLVPLYVDKLVVHQSEICIISALVCWICHVIFCVKSDNLEYLDNLDIMYKSLHSKLNLDAYRYRLIIQDLLLDFDFQLSFIRLVMSKKQSIKLPDNLF
ncbi:MAG: hypothetical protein FJZ57_02160 [Chlamydiae bacterium]|nr:hypothetical protein [Chlamydiota bacterium]